MRRPQFIAPRSGDVFANGGQVSSTLLWHHGPNMEQVWEAGTSSIDN